jgi:hypothetical protein
MDSADGAFLSRRAPQCHKAPIFAEAVFPDLEYHCEQPVADPPDRAVLLRFVRAPVLVMRVGEDLLRFLEADAALRVAPQRLALGLAELESHGGVV